MKSELTREQAPVLRVTEHSVPVQRQEAAAVQEQTGGAGGAHGEREGVGDRRTIYQQFGGLELRGTQREKETHVQKPRRSPCILRWRLDCYQAT